MRRLSGLVVPALLAFLLLAAPVAAHAAPDADGTTILLAVEEGEPLGPDPMPRDAEENKARELAGYEDRELQFTWGAAWILALTGLIGLTVAGALYYLLVHKPSQEAAEAAGQK
jgi:hypothetical protein